MSFSPEIGKIKSKMLSQGWPRMILSLTIDGLHGLSNKQIEFKFPVCAIVGENGTCKSTILKAMACAYKGEEKEGPFPSELFPDTNWDKITKIAFQYQTRLGTKIESYSVTRPTKRWRGLPDRPKNKVYYLDLGRTQPIDSIIGASKIANKKIKETQSREIKKESVEIISEIMGRDYQNARYALTSASTDFEVGLLKLPFGEMSQFHQGTGEVIISDLVSAIERIPEYSLLIIDELESSLHPKAQRRLIRELLRVAR